MGYRIGSFNMRNIGKTSTGKKDSRDFSKIAQIIKESRFDVVALQEVLSEGIAFTTKSQAKRSILMELGPNWDFCWADSTTTTKTDRRGEGYAFLWNTRRLRLVQTVLDNGSIRNSVPYMISSRSDNLLRRPYYARFSPQGLVGGSNFEIRLICIHTYYGDDNSLARKKRHEELEILMKEVYPRISDKVYKNDMPHYTIMLGDYNVELKRPGKIIRKGTKAPAYLKADANDIVEVASWDYKKIKTVQDKYTTLSRSYNGDGEKDDEDESHDDSGFAHDYDHFSFEISQFEGVYMKVNRINAVEKFCENDFYEYSKKVSDHIPIIMEIELK